MRSFALHSVELTLLGDCALKIDGDVLSSVPANLFRAAAYLILSPSGTSLPRFRLSSLLWSHLDDARAAANMRQLIARIRHLQAEHELELLQADGTTLKLLAPGTFRCDLATLMDHLRGRHHLSSIELCELYQGELLSGIGEAGEGYEEWLARQRDMLHGEVSDRLSAALRSDATLSCRERATCARRMQTLDPYSEEALQVLMREAAEHRQLARLRQLYATTCAVLAEDLGVRPSSETQAMYQKLQASLTSRPVRQEQS